MIFSAMPFNCKCLISHNFLMQCVVGGCNASFASQGGLARHVPSHFSQQSSSKLSSQAKLKEESPSKAGLNKRKKLKNKRRCSLRTYLTGTQTNPISKCFLLCFRSFLCWKGLQAEHVFEVSPCVHRLETPKPSNHVLKNNLAFNSSFSCWY